ncbi:MAG TPA: MFS transporter [Gaiellales bacterium]|nr:MFS transporter [Gaiellales bacterium]
MTAALLRANARTFRSLRRHRNYRLFFTGQVVSVSGTWMQNIATAWLILELTHSPVAVGLLAVCQFLPFTVLGLFAGVVVDRFDARRTVIWTQATSMAFACALAALTLTGVVTAWEVLLLTALRGTVLVVDAPARQALTFEMVGRGELPNAIALNSSLFNAARVVGPAVGGLVVAVAGVGICFAANAASFGAVLAGLLLMRTDELMPRAANAERPTLLRGTSEAFRYVAREPRVLLALAVVATVSTLSFNFNVLLPVLARQTLTGGPAVLGTITACFGLGALVGALTSASLGRASWRVLIAGTAGFGLTQLALAPLAALVPAAVLLFGAGLSFTLWTSNANSLLQLAAPDALRGRVIGLYYFAFNGAGPLGGILAGWLSAAGGTEAAFAVSGIASLAMTAVAIAALAEHGRRGLWRGAAPVR